MSNTPRILIVDDEQAFCRSIVKVLTGRKLSAMAVFNAEAAMAELANNPYDVVVMDIKMPGIGGIELLKWVKEQRLPAEVIILSGHASMDVALEAVKLGAYDYLMKPCDIEDLLLKILVAFECGLEKEKCR